MRIPQSLRFALLTFRKGRLVGLFVVLSLALAIAGNAVTFSVMHGLLYRPLPYREADRIVLLGERERDRPSMAITSLLSSLPTWADYRERARTLQDWGVFNPIFTSLSRGDRSIAVKSARVSPGLLRSLGARLERGRLFEEAEGEPGGRRVVIVRAEFVGGALGSSGNPIGRTLLLDGEPHEIVGVLAEGFELIVAGIDLWVPFQIDPYTQPRTNRNVISIARMAPGVTMDDVDAEVATISRAIEAEHPDTHRGWTAEAINLRTEFPEPQGRVYMGLILGAVFFVLLIACANIANLLLARNQERQREIALRMALGAVRGRIVSQLTRESLILAAIGGGLGMALAAVAIPPIGERFSGVIAEVYGPRLDWPVLLYSLGITLACGVFFGLLPALQGFREDHFAPLKSGTSTAAGRTRAHRRLSGILVVAEVALSLVALGAGGALVRSFLEARTRDPGFELDGLLTVDLELPHWKYDASRATVAWSEVRERAGAVPGVLEAALLSDLPQNLFPSSDTFRVDARPIEAGARVPRAVQLWASPGYLETLGVPLLEGRFFTDGDRAGSAPVIAVSRSLAERRFPGRSGVGERITFRGRSREIVGVVGDVRQSVVPQADGGFEETVYLPMAQEPLRSAHLVVRAAGDPRALSEPLQAMVGSIDPDITITTVETMREYADRYMVGIDIFNPILAGFGLLALLLASLGTYGLVAYSVTQRTHEIGVRLAVGAQPREVVRMITLEGVRLGAVGLALGTVLLVPILVISQGILVQFGLRPVGPVFIVGIGALLFAVTVLASVVPARRAAFVDPVVVLKAE